jgi:diadenylate cyclase
LNMEIFNFSYRLPGTLSFLTIRALDVLDILIVAYIIYRVFHLMKGTRAVQMLFGVLVLVAIGVAAHLYNLPGTGWFMDSLKTVWVVAFVILFQPEIRNALTQLGRNRFLGIFLRGEARAIEETVQACRMLVQRGFGGIIVFEKNDGLKDYTATGTEIGAKVTEPLLMSLFVPGGPLHDGAIIIRGDVILAAGCILPVSQDPEMAAGYGLRHRAAHGLTQETDAVAVVVSEENQAITVFRYGRLTKVKGADELKTVLSRALHAKVEAVPTESSSGFHGT